MDSKDDPSPPHSLGCGSCFGTLAIVARFGDTRPDPPTDPPTMTATLLHPTATPAITFAESLQRAARVNWSIDDILGAEHHLDFSKHFLPDALARVDGIRCLNHEEKRILNQIRGNSYLHLFALVEEFILPTVLGQVETNGLDDITASQALLHFAEEESKHIRLFRRFAADFEAGFGSHCACIGPTREIAAAVLQHSPLGVLLTTLFLEWMTQSHYLSSVQGKEGVELDPQFCSLLRHHWLEEAQHAALDTLMLDQLVRTLGPGQVRTGAEDLFRIAELLEGGLQAQVNLDLTSLERATGRRLNEAEIQEVSSIQRDSYLWTFLGSGLSHPRFVESFAQVSPDHLDRLVATAARYGGAAQPGTR
jgi:hypothetical protein